jgi:hypothetical protein
MRCLQAILTVGEQRGLVAGYVRGADGSFEFREEGWREHRMYSHRE